MTPPYITIDKESVNDLPAEHFTGEIRLVETKDDALKAIEELRQSHIIGLDTETRPTFHRGKLNKVALLQISTYTTCYLFRINKIGFIAALRELLSDAQILKVGLSLRDDFSMLHRRAPFEPNNCVELQTLAQEHGIVDMSLQKVYAIIFGKKICKGQRLTNWEADELTPQQQHYAALDAWACLNIYDALQQNQPFYISSCKKAANQTL